MAGGEGAAASREAARAELYGVLSGAFARELDEEAWAHLCGPEARTALRGLAAACEVEVDAGALLACLIEGEGRDPAATVEALAEDYARLFIGPGPGLAPPYESLYTSAERRYYGDAFSEVAALLRAEGIQVAAEFAAPADHIAVELAIMRHLAQKPAAPGQPHPWHVQREFLDGHLLRWAPRWVADVAREAATGFYRGAASLLDAFLSKDAVWLRRATGTPPAGGDAVV